MTNIVCYFE